MFGYVKPFKPQLRMCEYDLYQSFYCGLCKMLGKKFGFVQRMTLSYDFAFLGLLEYSLDERECSLSKQSCIAHPFKKTPCLDCKLDTLNFTACCSCILVYNKFRDDFNDGNIFKKIVAKIMMLLTKGGYKKAAAQYPKLSEFVSQQIDRQFDIENSDCKSMDKASDPSSCILGEMASYLGKDNEQKSFLYRFGYMLGRYIYIIDAYDDFEKDLKHGGFNPFISENDIDIVTQSAEDSINLTLGALSDAYVKLEIKRFKPILDNIVYLGLKNNFYNIKKGKKHE